MRLAAVIASLGLCGTSAAAQMLLDQSNVVPTSGSPSYLFHEVNATYEWAQTFTVGKSGTLSSVEVQAYRNPNARQPLLFDVRPTTSSGAPVEDNAAALATGTIPLAALPIREGLAFPDPPVLVPLDLGPFNIHVEPGDVLAIVLRSTEPEDFLGGRGYSWQGAAQGADAYAGGDPFQRGSLPTFFPFSGPASTDAGFRTFVTVPEPAAALGLAGFAAALLLRRRRLQPGR